MRISSRGRSFIIATTLLLYPASSLAQSSIVLGAVKDNTLYENAGGLLSNGIGSYLFAGRTGSGAIRRAVIAFNVDGVLPNDAAIDSVQFTLTVSRTNAPPSIVSLHRLEADWGESSSNAAQNEGQGAQAVNGDATWLHARFPETFWASPGGDFDETPSASRTVGAAATYTWYSTQRLTDDVRNWRENPDQNFGWLIKGDEAATGTAKRFDSREILAPSSPYLRIYYPLSTATEGTEQPGELLLVENYPNPFRGRTTVAYELGTPAFVTLDIFDMTGKRVDVAVSKWQHPGRHEVTFESRDLPAGIYLYRLSAGVLTRSGTMVSIH